VETLIYQGKPWTTLIRSPAGRLVFNSNLAAAGTFDPSIVLSAGYPTPIWTVTHPDGTVETSNSLTPSFTISGTGITRCELGPVSLYPYITTLDANADGLVGTFTARDLSLLPNLRYLYLQTNASLVFGFDIAELPTTLSAFRVENTSASTAITGDMSDFPSTLTYWRLAPSASTITGTVADIPAGVTVFIVAGTAPVITGGAVQTVALAMTTFSLSACPSISQADVDSIALRFYTDRALFTGGTLAIYTDSTTGDLSGIYQDATPPTTGNEYVYKLVVDPDNDHDKVFTWAR
jgi:hypothetical protein